MKRKEMTRNLPEEKQRMVEEDTGRSGQRSRGRAFVLSARVPAYLVHVPCPSPISNLTGILNKKRSFNCKL